MAILIGVDEAGYGPNLGPLVVAATAWRVGEEGVGGQGSEVRGPQASRALPAPTSAGVDALSLGSPAAIVTRPLRRKSADPCDLYRHLKKGVVRCPSQCAKRVAIADSKALYKAGDGLRLLERAVLAAVRCMAACDGDSHGSETLPANRTSGLFLHTRPDPDGQGRRLPWHGDADEALPIDTTADDLDMAERRLGDACQASAITLLAVRARYVHPAEFNGLCDEFGTKGAALSHVTLALVREVVERALAQPRPSLVGAEAGQAPAVHITLDKHGGRNRYAALVQHHFPDSWIDVVDEGRAASTYRWTHGEAPVEAVFRVRGEAALPTALASMTAKYHRELAMRQFNAFWTARVPGLAPTCGYPGDAHRFKADIADEQRRLGIDDRILWRNR